MESPSLTDQQRRSNRIKLLILWLVPFLLMAIAWIVFYLVEEGRLSIGSKNNGDLIRPAVQIKDVFRQADNEELASVWNGKWSMAIRVIGHCDALCEDALYLSRQIHIRLDKEANRVQRLMLVDNPIGDAEFKQFLDTDHSLLKVLSLESLRGDSDLNAFDQVLQQTVASTKTQVEDGQPPQLTFFIVDPAGFAMMAYHQGHDGNAILQDLKHLLKFSRQR